MSAESLEDSGAETAAVTYNGNPSYETTGKHHIDYFAGITRQTPDKELAELVKKCVESDRRLAVATFFQKRDCRGGAGERKPFLLSVKELPESLRHSLYPIVPEYGYWDDLNAFARSIPEDRSAIADLFAMYLSENIIGFETGVIHRPLEKWLPTEGQQDDKTWGAVKKIIRAFNRQNKTDISNIKEEIARKLGQDLQDQIKKIDPYAEVISGQESRWSVKEDQEHLWSDETTAKILEVSRRFSYISTKSVVLPNSISKMTLTIYRKWCSFMRAYYEVIEHYKSEGNWDLINYSKVPSIAFNRTKKQFMEHSPERFGAFMKKVDSGEQKINVGQLMPFELLSQESSEVRDAQWKLVVEETKRFYEQVSLENAFHPRNTIHVADVSGSMTMNDSPRPIDVALSLAFLGGEVGGRPVYTFSTTPKRYEPTWSSLTEAQMIVQDENCSTNLRRLIDRVYDEDQLPKSIFIYTDGGFDMMCHESPTTAADYIKEKFGDANMPTIVFWNVAGNIGDFAATTQHENIVQVAGFSKDLYGIFTRLTSSHALSLEAFFQKAVLNERYQAPLDVYDSWNMN